MPEGCKKEKNNFLHARNSHKKYDLSMLDISSLDTNAISNQFGIPAEAVENFLKMIKK